MPGSWVHDRTRWDEVAADQAVGVQVGHPGRFTHVALASRRYSELADPSAAKVFAGSRARSRSSAAGYRDVILEKLELGLSVQRVFQDLQKEYGYGHSYESVKR